MLRGIFRKCEFEPEKRHLIAKGQSEAVAKLLREAKPLIPFVLEKIIIIY